MLAGVAVLAIYKYNQMTDEEKDTLIEKGRKLFDEHISPFLHHTLGLTEDSSLLSQGHKPIKINGISS